MRSTPALVAQQRFHRYVAVLFATTVPFVAVVEFMRAVDTGTIAMARFAGPMIVTAWAIAVAKASDPNAVRLVLGAMGFTGALVALEAAFEVEITSFDYATAFALIMLIAVLAGTLAVGKRVTFAVSLAVVIASWVILVGFLNGSPSDAIAMQAVIAVAGVLLTTALVSELYDQLSGAINAFERSRKLQEAIGRCSEALLVHPDSFALFEAVRAVFEATDADFAYIDKTREVDDELGWEIVAHASKLMEGQGTNWQTGMYSAIPSTYEALSTGKEAVIYTSQLTGHERDVYEKDEILSELCVPIYVGKVFRGSIGFVEYSTERKWTDAEIDTLWRAADMVGAYLKRQDDADALKASNESKDKLLASVSHEIRTPLTAIVGLSEEIVSSRSTMGPDEIDELNGIIATQSRELAELVEDLLVASRADFGNLSIRPEAVSLADQVDLVLAGMREASPKGKTIAFSGGDATAWADPLRVRQIIRNLVTNAIKYGGDNIVLALRSEGDIVSVVVADNGSGVTAREAGLIFERYYRSSESPTQPGSVGIGLAVSRQLAEMMSGVLDYVPGESQHRFELSLPAATPHPGSLELDEFARI